MSSSPQTAAEARAFLQLPAELVAPENDMLVDDARAILLHNLTLHKEVAATGIVISPIWEEHEGRAALRAAIVPPEVTARYFEGKGLASMREESVLQMVADALTMLLEEPVAAARALETTHTLWVSEDAPKRELPMPYKGHFKLLTLLLADLARKVSAGFDELEWLASLGLLDAFHDPATDPPAEQVAKAARDKLAKMCADEDEWMRALVAN